MRHVMSNENSSFTVSPTWFGVCTSFLMLCLGTYIWERRVEEDWFGCGDIYIHRSRILSLLDLGGTNPQMSWEDVFCDSCRFGNLQLSLWSSMRGGVDEWWSSSSKARHTRLGRTLLHPTTRSKSEKKTLHFGLLSQDATWKTTNPREHDCKRNGRWVWGLTRHCRQCVVGICRHVVTGIPNRHSCEPFFTRHGKRVESSNHRIHDPSSSCHIFHLQQLLPQPQGLHCCGIAWGVQYYLSLGQSLFSIGTSQSRGRIVLGRQFHPVEWLYDVKNPWFEGIQLRTTNPDGLFLTNRILSSCRTLKPPFDFPNIPLLQPKVYLSGKVILERDPKTGLITSYREKWDQDVNNLVVVVHVLAGVFLLIVAGMVVDLHFNQIQK